MRHLHKKIFVIVQVLAIATVIFTISGVIGAVVFLLGEISIAELIEYLQGLFVGESMGVIGSVLFKKKLDELFYHFKKKKRQDLENENRIEEIRKMIRR
ncbi:MAG: hypothetical protein ACREBB_06650 [Nitrosotalea sp.]